MYTELVFSTTHQCPISCRYCATASGPRVLGRLSKDFMCNIIEQMKQRGSLFLVVFTGGEAFLLGDDLINTVRYACSRGASTRIVTNAYWATSHQRAVDILQQYKEAGLNELNVSVDDLHQEFIPLENIQNVWNACRSIGMPLLFAHKLTKNCKITKEYLDSFLGTELRIYQPGDFQGYGISTGLTVPIAENMDQDFDDIIYPPDNDHWKGPCKSILTRIIITPQKQLAICCGMISQKVPEIFFGSLEKSSLDEILQSAHDDLIVNWLALKGPSDIMDFVKKKSPWIRFREKFVNICDACNYLFTHKDARDVLQLNAHEKIGELTLLRATFEYSRYKYGNILKGKLSNKN